MHEFVDQTFLPETTGEKILSIQASLDGFSFSIVCPIHKKLLYFKDISLKISNESLLARHFQSVFSEETLLHNKFKEVYLLYHSRNFTLLPEHIYEKQIEKKIAPFLFEENTQCSWINENLAQIKGELLFSVPKNFVHEIKKCLPAAHIKHNLQLLIEHTGSFKADPKLNLYFERNHFSLSLFSENELKLINNFSFKHQNDMVYFVLTVLRQFAVSAKDITTLFAGNLKSHNGLPELLQKHFPHALPINPNIAMPPFIDETLIAKNISLFL